MTAITFNDQHYDSRGLLERPDVNVPLNAAQSNTVDLSCINRTDPPLGPTSGGLGNNADMRAALHHRSIFSNTQPFSRMIRQQCYSQCIENDQSNWRWYYHLAREMIQSKTPLTQIGRHSHTPNDLLIRAIAINPNEGANWQLLSDNWPNNKETLSISLEGSAEFRFSRSDAEAMASELQTANLQHLI